MRAVIGVDPGSSYTGLACATLGAGGDVDPTVPHLLALEGVVMDRRDVTASVRERVLPSLLRMSWRTGMVVVLEEPPEYSHADVGHGSESRIGYALGWLSGLVVGACGLPSSRVRVSDWRLHMLTYCARRGLMLSAPRRSDMPGVSKLPQRQHVRAGVDRGSFIRSWVGCAHEQPFATFAALHACADVCCPVCNVAPKEGAEAAWVRDEWKRIAVAGVARFWPALLQDVVLAARGRAIDKAQPDHQLGGVADACEAAWIALYGASL